jgi:type II secretory ATPase GspE/PulE/Tfp pilus assembly ATPase PilB-like protein
VPDSHGDAWPLPPYFSLAAQSTGTAEACVADLFDGTGVAGHLAAFRPEEGVIEVAPPGHAAAIVAPDALRRLRLTSPIGLVPMADKSVRRDIRLSADKRRFAIQYRDGRGEAGETRGFLHDRRGTYLYVAQDEKHCERWYVPDSAGRVRIGESLGDILVREKVVEVPQVEAARRERDAARTRKIGDILVHNRTLSQEQLDEALHKQQGLPSARLGDILVEHGVLTQPQLEQALKAQQRDRSLPLGDVLIRSGLASREDVVRGLAIKLGVPSVDVRGFAIDPGVLELIPLDVALASQALPLYREGMALVVAAANPLDVELLRRLQFITGLRVIPVLASAEDVLARLEKEHAGHRGATTPPLLATSASKQPDTPALELAVLIEAENVSSTEPANADPQLDSSNTLVRLVNRMVLDAHAQGASDIHIETNPGTARTRVRLRLDGVMTDYLELPATARSAVISRIKIMSNLDISERRHPQDGKISFRQFGPADLDLRVAVIPTAGGLEDIVIRLLSSAKPLPIGKLGLTAADLANLKRLSERSYGLLLVCGPTGSGKTTTLHSVLSAINTPELKIWTAEDPIEIRQEGLRQVQVNARIGFTFAAALRSFLRADPDVIMVGEIRDAETARIAIESSLTGHLVFSTLHTNSATESIVRLLDLGMDPFNFADALLGIVGQRLARRLCAQCRARADAGEDMLRELAGEYCRNTQLEVPETIAAWRREYGGADGHIGLWRAQGCDACHGSGYRGRLGVYELLVSNPNVKRLIQARAPVHELLAAAQAEGMKTLMQDGGVKVLQGLTDLVQVRSACA